MISSHAKLSFCIPFFNQERYVADTLRGVFSQTYANIEIVICDDCSTDGTVAAIERGIADYRRSGGNVPIVFERNSVNLGIVRNWERVFRLAHGDLLVSSGGDDISYPNRAEEIAAAWESDKRSASIIIHGFDRIGTDGRPSESTAYDWEISAAHPLGAVTAYSRRIVDDFDRISDPDGFEDQIFARRALLVGEELKIHKPLLAYRIGSGDTTSGADPLSQRIKTVRRCLHSYPQTFADIERAEAFATPERLARVRSIAEECRRRYPAEYDYLTAQGFWTRFRAYRNYRRVWGLPNHLASILDFISDQFKQPKTQL